MEAIPQRGKVNFAKLRKLRKLLCSINYAIIIDFSRITMEEGGWGG